MDEGTKNVAYAIIIGVVCWVQYPKVMIIAHRFMSAQMEARTAGAAGGSGSTMDFGVSLPEYEQSGEGPNHTYGHPGSQGGGHGGGYRGGQAGGDHGGGQGGYNGGRPNGGRERPPQGGGQGGGQGGDNGEESFLSDNGMILNVRMTPREAARCRTATRPSDITIIDWRTDDPCMHAFQSAITGMWYRPTLTRQNPYFGQR